MKRSHGTNNDGRSCTVVVVVVLGQHTHATELSLQVSFASTTCAVIVTGAVTSPVRLSTAVNTFGFQ